MRLSSYAGAESENTAEYIRFNSKPPSFYNNALGYRRYKCLICGEEVCTYVHAEKHGFDSKDEMINRGLAVMITNNEKI